MDSNTIAVYIPILIIILIVFSESKANRNWIIIKIHKGQKGLSNMSVHIKKYIGKKCVVSTGSFGVGAQGIIRAVEDNWLEIEVNKRKSNEIINLDFVQKINILDK